VTVTAPRHYTALTGDLLVALTTTNDVDDSPLNNTEWYIDVIEARDTGGNLSPLTTVDIPGGYGDGEISIGCGIIDVAGPLIVRLIDTTSSDVVAQSDVVNVRWPSSVALRLPDGHIALDEDFPVTLTVGHITCQSQHSHIYYTLQLVYLGGVNSSASVFDSSSLKTVVFKQTLQTLASPSTHIRVSCSLLDRAGRYQAVLMSSRRRDMPVAISSVVTVEWSRSYTLSSSSLSAPCHHHVVVHHTQPRCHDVFYTVRIIVRQPPTTNRDNNVRLDGTQNSEDVKRFTLRDWRYVSERHVKSSGASVTFDCELFQRDNVEHCVLLFSTASDNTVHVHQRYCTTSSIHPHTAG